MFENLSERLSGVFDRLTKQGALSEDDGKTALREVRVALREADVSLLVARDGAADAPISACVGVEVAIVDDTRPEVVPRRRGEAMLKSRTGDLDKGGLDDFGKGL